MYKHDIEKVKDMTALIGEKMIFFDDASNTDNEVCCISNLCGILISENEELMLIDKNDTRWTNAILYEDRLIKERL